MGNQTDGRTDMSCSGDEHGPWPAEPRAHRNQTQIHRKLALLDEPHVKSLNDWVRELNRARSGRAVPGESLVPWFDPSGGGIAAKILFLLEAPGSRASASRGSGFVSIDNNDGTAANCFALVREAGLSRCCFASWNIVPWYLPDGSRTQVTRLADVLEATQDLETVLAKFEHLNLVIAMGTHAKTGWELLRARSSAIRSLTWQAAPHPSATNLNTRPEQRAELLRIMNEAARTCQ
ncbi:uracil-DNA glycosylase [Arthrobacter sp. ISL-30]|uniref:uracil-DNA glycosylase n=1 Tax=Arthrobacter sp. ISL-30 TaxID=2819109 RepID=UPI001BE52A13|nr:uracil-DNA glycosylase [Arthrobacter sp. ISL-30]MBT2513158.1 uracil-DNA glycosylase [Arthrobacter sp. ISL-30]